MGLLYLFTAVLLCSACAPKAWTPPNKEHVIDPGRIPSKDAMKLNKKKFKAARKIEKQK